MFSLKNLKKYLVVLLFAIFAGAVFQTGTTEVSAFEFGDLFEAGGDQGLSFTEFEGGLATLEDTDYDSSLTTSNDIREFIIRIVNFALGFLGLIAVIIVIYGGVQYVTAAGEQEKTDKGKKAITYATIGLLIVMGSFAFVNTVIGGASGDGEGGGGNGTLASNTGANFNAAAAEVRTIARDIYDGFVRLAEVEQELRSIVSDANKASLSYTPDEMGEWKTDPIAVTQRRSDPVPEVSRSNVLKFLFSVKEKLTNIKQKSPKFSSAYSTTNNVIRLLDGRIDLVQSLSESLVELDYDYFEGETSLSITNDGINVSGGKLVGCGFYEDLVKPCSRYPKELYQKWPEIKAKLLKENPSDADGSIFNIYDPLKEVYLAELRESYTKIEEINSILRGIEAAEIGTNVGTLYADMIGLYGYEAGALHTSDTSYSGFTKMIKDLSLDEGSPNNIEVAGAQLFEALKVQIEWANKIEELTSVQARLHANVVTGTAPLVVTFDVVNSVDPAGGAIIPGNVIWRQIDGSQTLDGEEVALPAGSVTNCVTTSESPDPDVVGAAFRQCTFNHPGTYIATVEIKSNDPKKYVNGRSSLVIKVLPPTTQINMTMRAGDKTFIVMDYYDNGLLRINKDKIAVTLKEAQAGIAFNATQTDNVESFSWDFGDNTNPDDATTDSPVHAYETEGQYKVILEVVNTLGQADRKIVTIDVRDLAARVRVSPNEDVFINQPVRIDAELSASTTGAIRSYAWRIVKDEVVVKESDKAAFNYEFPEPGKYKIYLTATNSIDESTDDTTIEIASKPPVAKFTDDVKKANKPNTVSLNASDSFDPDGTDENLEYQWTITPPSAGGENWEWENGVDDPAVIIDSAPQIKFNKKQDYDVTLKVIDTRTVGEGLTEEFGETSKTITIDNLLDVDWGIEQESTGVIDETGVANMEFLIISDNAVAYEIDFGDGETDSGNMDGITAVSHVYSKSGKYRVKVTVYDDEDDDNSIERRFLISGGDQPVAYASVFIDGAEIFYVDEPIVVGTSDLITFDASGSKNTDGTGRDLKYQWNFGDTDNSTSKSANHKYKELSPPAGFYTVSLKVTDKDDPTKTNTDEIKINVVNFPPRFSSVQGLVGDHQGELITPLQVDMRVYGAEDDDGKIVKYKWWYFDIDDPEEQLGIQITDQPSAKLTIGTRGEEGQKMTYGFGLEVTDNDDLKFSNQRAIDDDQFAKIEVKNGANAAPVAKFNVNITSVFVGDEVNFSSASTDADGQIERYIWDLEGDGFFNNEPTDEATITHKYITKNLDGYAVKLKVIDDKGGETISDPIKIFVDSNAVDPVAAFKYRVVDGSQGMKIAFENKSTFDTESGVRLISTQWDFDTASTLDTADSDGDGKKDNDVDSDQTNPSRLYAKQGEYKVKLTIVDNQGGKDEVINTIRIPLADPPVAAFKYTIDKDKVRFENNSTADEKADARIKDYIWDFDTNSILENADSDGDGKKDNDNDSELAAPIHVYNDAGLYKVKLTVIDNQGNSDEVIRDVNFTKAAVIEPIGSIVDDYAVGGGSVKAILASTPQPREGIVYLNRSTGSVRFDFVGSRGNIATYTIDKNILFDTDGNGIADDDEDFKTFLPGAWTTNFESSWGRIIVRLTVEDIHGNKDVAQLEIRFQ